MKFKKRTASITIKVEPKTKEEIIQYAADHNLSITDVLENGFIYLKSIEKKQE